MKPTTKPTFTADFFRGNREKLRALFTGTAPIVLTAHGTMQRNGDGQYPFRQDSSFWYLTGLTEPDIILVIDKHKEYLILPDRDQFKQAFDGTFDHEQFVRTSGIEEIYDEKQGWKKLEAKLKKVRHIATLAPSPAFVEWYDMYTNPARARLLERIKEINPDIEPLDLRTHLSRMRSIKQPIELEAIQHAIDVTVATLARISRRLPKYQYEYEIEADLTQGFRQKGLHHAFSPVISSGKHTSMIHYFANDDSLDGTRLLYFDVGAESNYYSADITRTYFLKDPSAREQKIYQAVLEAYRFGLELIKPGASMKDNEQKAEQFLGEKLRELGLIKLLERDEIRKYYPHRLSHFLGLETHDVGDYNGTLQPGMVLTVEPGIYIPEEGIGIRIEDDILVTEDGMKVLSERLPIPLS